MNKSIVLFLALVCSLSAFTILQTDSLQSIPWPFNPCGTGDWTIEKLTLAAQPTRNANNDIDVVRNT
jgi:hypothetical protein